MKNEYFQENEKKSIEITREMILFDDTNRAWKSEIALRRPFFSHFGTLFEKHQYISFYVSYDDDSTCAGFP